MPLPSKLQPVTRWFREQGLRLDPARVTDEHRHLRPDATRCRCCGEALTEIGEETSTRIEREPTRFRRVITHRHKMACSSCRQGGVTIARPDDPPTFGAGMVGTSLAVDMVLMHYDDHLPFHRMARILRRYGLRPYRYPRQHRSTLCVRAPESFHLKLWDHYCAADDVLRKHMEEVTDHVIRTAVYDDPSEVPVVADRGDLPSR